MSDTLRCHNDNANAEVTKTNIAMVIVFQIYLVHFKYTSIIKSNLRYYYCFNLIFCCTMINGKCQYIFLFFTRDHV